MDDNKVKEAENMVREGVAALFARWTALRLAAENCDGGNKRRNVPAEVLDTCVMLAIDPDKTHPSETFESLFYDGFELLNTDVEDGSVEQISAEVCRIRNAASNGDYGPAREAIEKTRKRLAGSLATKAANRKEQTETSLSNFEKPKLIDPSAGRSHQSPELTPSGPIVDDDGFTTVVKKKRRGTRS